MAKVVNISAKRIPVPATVTGDMATRLYDEMANKLNDMARWDVLYEMELLALCQSQMQMDELLKGGKPVRASHTKQVIEGVQRFRKLAFGKEQTGESGGEQGRSNRFSGIGVKRKQRA